MPPDGLDWLPGKAAAIREDNLYGGVRIKLIARLGNIRIPVQVDVGFGDAITPEARREEWPGVLDFPPVSLLAYCPETTIAEKLHAAVVLATANSRMKDFFDLHWLCRHKSFHGDLLREAVEATFRRRSTAIPKARVMSGARRRTSTQSSPSMRRSSGSFLKQRRGRNSPSSTTRRTESGRFWSACTVS